MRNLILLATALTLPFGLASCGGGGGSGSVGLSSSTGTGNTSTAETKSINGGVYSSYVANAEVCLEDPSGNILTDSNGEQLCSTTHSDGVFQLQLPADFSLSNDDLVGLYVKTSDGSTIKIAEAPVSQLEVNGTTDTLAITPLSIAENDQNLADTIGALIHALGGDTTGDADVVDLGNVEISNLEAVNQNGQPQPVLLNGNTSLEDLLKEKEQIILQVYQEQLGQAYQVTVNPNNTSAPVSVNLNGTLTKIAYNCQAHQEEIEEHLKALEALASGNTSEYLQAKTVAALLSLKNFLSHLSYSPFASSISDADKQTIQDLVNTTIPSLINDVNENGLNADALSGINNLISQLNTLISDLQSVGFRPPMFTIHLENTVSLLESIEQYAENSQSSQSQQTTAENSTGTASETNQTSNESSSQSSQTVQGTSSSTSSETSNTSSENTAGTSSSTTVQTSSEGSNMVAGS